MGNGQRPELVVHAPRAISDGRRGEEPLSVLATGGVVTEVRPLDRGIDANEVVSLSDDEVLLPGLVDTHVHVNEPGRTEWEGFATATRAAGAGGVTTILDMPLNSLPPTLDADALAVKRAAAAGKCAVDVGFWGGAVPRNVPALGRLLSAGVFGVKCFLSDSGVEEFPPLDRAGLLLACEQVAAHDGLLLVHAEDPGVLDASPAPRGRSYRGFLSSRPPTSEEAAIATVIEAARRTGARVHIVHLSSAGALPLIEQAKADGLRLTVETCPHYLVLRAEDVPDGATAFKCCPPVREDTNRSALWEGLSAGLIDLVVSDHSPCVPALKDLERGDFSTAWGGISSLQLGLPLVWSEARRRGHDLADVVSWMAAAPAAFAGLATKGALCAGRAADFVVFAPEDELVVDPAALYHRNPVTPYTGMRLTGQVRSTWLAGAPVGAGTAPAGRLLARGEA